jgi:hypothetical protein
MKYGIARVAWLVRLGLALGAGLCAAPAALAEGPALVAQATEPAKAADAAPAKWMDTLKFSARIEFGATLNPDDPGNDINFGHLFTDRSNSVLLNQVLLTAERPLDPKAEGYDFGFKLQGMYGSDARYTHFLGEFDRSIGGRNQFDIVEANVVAHLPLLSESGIDLKIGQYPTPLGAEVIDASGNFFYSHSYIFNFGIPLKHTGVLSTAHVSSLLDLYLGVDTGVNTSLGRKGDNNDALAGIGGFGLNMLDGKLTVLALTHIGPEQPRSFSTLGLDIRPNSDLRYLNDILVTWKATEELTSMTELNYIRDDGFGAHGFGVAQYLTYTVNDWLSVGGRAEYWRDDNGAFVAAFPGNQDFVNAERGLFPFTAIGGGKTSYGELTLGVNLKPPVGAPFDGIVVRPEVRYDRSLNDTTPFDAGTKRDQFTFGIDTIISF